MKFYLFMVLAFLSSCAQTTKKTEPKLEPVNVTAADILACQDYQKLVLERAYTESKAKGAKSTEINFTKDEALAREVLGKFDVNLGLTRPKANLVQNILQQCDETSIKKFDNDYKQISHCTLMFSELNFFQSLSVALRKYPWPTDLKLEGKKVALDYVRYFSEGKFPLLNRLVALSVLDELSVNEIVNKELHQEVVVLMQESRAYVEGLRLKLNKDPGLSCQSLSIIRDELAYSDVVAKKMKDFLTRI